MKISTFSNTNSNAGVELDAQYSTGAFKFSIGGSPKMTLTSGGDLLVGKTSGPNYNVVGVDITHLGEGQFTVNNSEVLQLNRKSSDGNIVTFRKDGTSVGSIGNNTDFYIASQDGTGVRFSATQVLPCSESGATQNGSRDLGASNARFKDLYLSSGVYLGGTGAANKLDDYESGTWTPIAGPIGSTGAVGTYTKIGDRCFFTAEITMGASSNTGHAYITLPFVASSSASNTGGACLGWTDYGAAAYAYVLPSYARFYIRSVTGAHLTYANISSKTFRFSGSIIVA